MIKIQRRVQPNNFAHLTNSQVNTMYIHFERYEKKKTDLGKC